MYEIVSFLVLIGFGCCLYYLLQRWDKSHKKKVKENKGKSKFIGPLFFIGIMLIPILAVLLFIRPGYSNKAKWISGVYLFLITIGIINYQPTSQVAYNTNNTSTSAVKLQNNKTSVDDIIPPQQIYLSDITKRTKAKIKTGDNDAKVKLIWIKASKELCESKIFDAYGIKSNFIGYVVNVIAHDDGNIGIKIMLEDHDKLEELYHVFDGKITSELHDIVFDLKEGGIVSRGDKVKFSGYFQKGKISQNECLDAGLDANPEFEGETFNFKLTKIEKI